MNYQPLGRSGLITSELALGTMIFGETSGRATPPAEARRLIDRYLDAGGNHFDTADVYAGGRSEEIVGEAIRGRRDRVLVATKARFRWREGDVNAEGLSRHNLTTGVEASLRRLGTDYLDLLYLHCFDPVTPLAETLRALDDLVRAGKVRYLGVSNFKAWQLMKAQGLLGQIARLTFVAAQYQYSLVKRDLEYEFDDLLPAEGLGLVPWGPLGGGFLTGKYTREGPTEGRIATTAEETEESWSRRDTERNWGILDAVRAVAATHDATPTQVAIAWLLQRPIVSTVLLGARTLDQLEDNLGARDVTLSADDLRRLDDASALPELYPYRMIRDYGGRSMMRDAT